MHYKEVGVLVPTDDVDSLAKAMEKMILSPESYDSECSREYVKQRCSVKAIASSLEKVYRGHITVNE